MSEILRRLQALRADQAIIVAQEREAKRIREEERQTAKEAERKLSVECGKLLDDLGVNKMLEELNSGVLKNKGKIVNLQGLLPHTHTWDEGSGIANYSNFRTARVYNGLERKTTRRKGALLGRRCGRCKR